MRYKSTCGLTPAQTTDLIARAWEVHQSRRPGERYAFELQFGRAVVMVLISAYSAHTDWAARPKPSGKPRPVEDIRFNRTPLGVGKDNS